MNLLNVKKLLRRLVEPIIVIAVALSLSAAGILYKQKLRLLNEVELKTNNIEAYQGIISELTSKNTVLRLDIATLSQSNDKLLLRIDSVSDELKISNKRLKIAMATSLDINVSEKDTVLVSDSCSFKKRFKPNDLTLLDISLAKDTLEYVLLIHNDLYLFVYTSREYKNKNKKFFKRLTTFDWKKITYYRYEIVNTNNLIKVGSTRVVENTESK